jgi:hypothetical protein
MITQFLSLTRQTIDRGNSLRGLAMLVLRLAIRNTPDKQITKLTFKASEKTFSQEISSLTAKHC